MKNYETKFMLSIQRKLGHTKDSVCVCVCVYKILPIIFKAMLRTSAIVKMMMSIYENYAHLTISRRCFYVKL
jgi:hypothetical protein